MNSQHLSNFDQHFGSPNGYVNTFSLEQMLRSLKNKQKFSTKLIKTLVVIATIVHIAYMISYGIHGFDNIFHNLITALVCLVIICFRFFYIIYSRLNDTHSIYSRGMRDSERKAEINKDQN
jgi:hypothetical protein